MPKSFVSTLRSQWLGQQLRILREQRGMPLKDVAIYLNRDLSALGRYERAEWPIGRAVVVELLDLYGEHGITERATMLGIAETVWRQHLWDTDAGPYPQADAAIITTEWLISRAERLYLYQPALNTAFLEATMQRVGAKPVEAVIADTAIVERHLGQLAGLRLRSGLDIRFLPARAALDGPREPFSVFVMPKPYPPVGYQESLAGRLVIEGHPAHQFAETYRQLQAAALSPAASARTAGLDNLPGSP